MDPLLSLSWSKRIKYLRWATRYSYAGMAVLLNCVPHTIKSIENGGRPQISLVRRIRLLEKIFSPQLDRFKKNVRRWGERESKFERTDKYYVEYEGTNLRVKTRYFGKVAVPEKRQDIEALGGMEVIRRAAGAKRGATDEKSKQPQQYRKEGVYTPAERERRRENGKRTIGVARDAREKDLLGIPREPARREIKRKGRPAQVRVYEDVEDGGELE